jgi:hypothetical protein
MDIVIKDGGVELASGALAVDTSGPSTTATFTPEGGTLINCTGVVWTSTPNGAVGFGFQISGQANGDFPTGPNGPFNYRFTGVQNSNGLPNGTVTWPNHGPAGDPEPTWQGEATEEEPYVRGQGAT